eukprot:6194798-Pleurochrysis_carterae.AAC.3
MIKAGTPATTELMLVCTGSARKHDHKSRQDAIDGEFMYKELLGWDLVDVDDVAILAHEREKEVALATKRAPTSELEAARICALSFKAGRAFVAMRSAFNIIVQTTTSLNFTVAHVTDQYHRSNDHFSEFHGNSLDRCATPANPPCSPSSRISYTIGCSDRASIVKCHSEVSQRQSTYGCRVILLVRRRAPTAEPSKCSKRSRRLRSHPKPWEF